MSRLPRTPAEFRCLLERLETSGAFGDLPAPLVKQAIQDVARAIEAAKATGNQPSACESLVGILFIQVIEDHVDVKPTSIVIHEPNL